MSKRILAVLLVLVLALGLMGTGAFAAEGDIVILHTNDVHCGLHDGLGYDGLAAYMKEMEAEYGADNVTLIDAGDAVQGAAIGTLSEGEYLIDIMNYLGYDFLVPGNHEFDYKGVPRLLELDAMSDVGYYACNFIDLQTGEPVFDAYKLITYGETTVAYVGICTPETFTKSTPAYFQDEDGNFIYSFCEGNNGQDLYDAVQKAIDDAKAEGADYVIAVGHLGDSEESAPWRSEDVIANVSGLSAFIDGHSHSTVSGKAVTDKDGNTVLLNQTGTELAAIGKIVLSADGSVTAELITGYTEKDPETTEFIAGIEAEYEDLTNEVVANTDIALTTMGADGNRAVRNKETNLGDLCADSIRYAVDSDIAILGGGGIRADLPVDHTDPESENYIAGAKAGDITYGDILAVHPYNNSLCSAEITGAQLLDVLEMSCFATPGESGGFMQVSGLTFTIDTSVPTPVVTDEKGQFVEIPEGAARRVSDVMVNGEPLDLDKTYTLGSTGYYLKEAGDGFTMLTTLPLVQEDVQLDSQALIAFFDYLGADGLEDYADPAGQGRITILEAPEQGFTDVEEGDYFYDAVLWAVENGITEGTTDTTFGPDESCTRGQMVTFLWRAAGSPEPETTENPFTDVVEDAYYYKAMLWAVENGITEGTSDTTFGPEETVTRDQAVTFLYRAAGSPEPATIENPFTDLVEDAYYYNAVLWAVENDITTGTTTTTFGPEEPCIRGQVVTFLYRSNQAAAA